MARIEPRSARPRAALVALLLCGALVFGGCGGGDAQSGEASAPDPTTVANESPPVERSAPPPAERPVPVTTRAGREAAKRPEPSVKPPDREPPTNVVAEDLIEGSGRVARKGDELAVHFTAIRYDGEFFESIWDEPFDFELSTKDVSPGWVRGLDGMRVGGRRQLIVPAGLTSRYGVPPSENVPENSLVYVVDLLAVGSEKARVASNVKGPGPTVRLPAGPPPADLVVRDLVEGSGAPARPGDKLTVEYVGVRYDGAPFTNSWERRKPFTFRLGGGNIMVNPGWEKGLPGLRVGGRRELVIPPKLLQRGGALPESTPEDTLIYVIDLVDVER